MKLAQEKLNAGEQDLVAITQAMKSLIEAHPEIKIDYVTIADPSSLAELQVAQPAMVALIAARVGNTRLIDNQMLVLP